TEGLAAVHRAGFAHQDVKPSNIMLAPGNRVVLMDFGIAQPQRQSVPNEGFVGSPGYLAPEAVLEAPAASQRHLVDIYALGVVAYELLSGERLFSGEKPVDIWVQQLATAMPIPGLPASRPDVPPMLCSLI